MKDVEIGRRRLQELVTDMEPNIARKSSALNCIKRLPDDEVKGFLDRLEPAVREYRAVIRELLERRCPPQKERII